MITHSVIKKSQLEGAHRLDAEYYQPEYLELQKRLFASRAYKFWRDLEGKFITGPFGSEFNVENYEPDGKYRYVRGKDVKEFFLQNDDNVYIPEKDFERLKKYALQDGDILTSVVGTPGLAAIVDKSIVPSIFSCKSTVFRSTDINPYYFIAYLNSTYGYKLLKRSIRGALQTGLNIDDLKSLPLFVPGVKIQEQVAQIVKESKQEIENSKSLYSQAEQVLLEELGLQNFNVEDGLWSVVKLSEVKNAERMDADYFEARYEKLITSITKHNSRKLSELGDRAKGRNNKFLKNEDYNYIEISNIDVGTGGCSFKVLKGNDLPANAKIIINGGELLISKVRPTRGAVSIVPDNWNNNFIASGAFSVFEAGPQQKEYIQLVLRSVVGKTQLERPTTGSSYPIITDLDVENVLIPVLPKPIQQKIADLVSQSHAARAKAKELLQEAKRTVERLVEEGEK